jgi:hypothetical protein
VAGRNFQDLVVFLALVALGALGFIFSCQAPDFVGDVYYVELAKSIAGKAGYVFNSKPQTMVPPGFPFLLALMTMVVGSSYVVLIRSMTVFSTLSLLAAYEVLRSEEDRHAAGAICLLLGSSPLVFQFSTYLVFSDMPYCFTSIMLLWVLMRLDLNQGWIFYRTMWWFIAAALVIASVLMRSTGVALLGGILGWLIVSSFRARHTVNRRIGIFLPVILAGVIAQAAWMHWAAKHQVSEWPVHGYQEHYLAQLKLKSGNDPELGLATWRDILWRPVQNADDRAAALVGLLTRKQMAPAWYSPGTVIPLGLVLLGLGVSLCKNGGGFLEWYFISYEAMFLFWPWRFELRFVLPVLPLACLYMWRAGGQLWRFARDESRALGWIFFLLSAVGCLSSTIYGRSVEHPSARSCVTIWILIGVASIVLIQNGRFWSRLSSLLATVTSVRGKRLRVWQLLAASLMITLVLLGAVMQLRLGWRNVHFDLKADMSYPDIEAAEWIRAHSEPSAVVMARKEDLVFHYGQRRVIWFPPSSDPNVLMDGIRRYHVLYVIVGGSDTYWRPSTQECFEALSRAYPEDFQLAYQGVNNKVYVVAKTGIVRNTL